MLGIKKERLRRGSWWRSLKPEGSIELGKVMESLLGRGKVTAEVRRTKIETFDV